MLCSVDPAPWVELEADGRRADCESKAEHGMAGIWRGLIQTVALLYVASSLIPLLKSDAWWIRGWDFPRLQFAVVGLAAMLLLALAIPGWPLHKIALLLILAGSLAVDAYRIAPYTRLARVESLPAGRADSGQRLSIVVSNVLQDNKDPEPLRRVLADLSPDLVLLLEVDRRWMDDLAGLKSSHPFRVAQPLDNAYGIALFSRLGLAQARLGYLLEADIPSIRAQVVLGSGERVEVFGIHPRPPEPRSGDSTERDAELILVARKARESKLPVIVMGDLNDVAWSHTTRLFRRISGLLDPRIGRGHFPTFPVALPFLRYPLDHVFHSKSLRLADFRVLPDIGSDHFPVYAEFSLEPQGSAEQKSPQADSEDLREARETVGRAK